MNLEEMEHGYGAWWTAPDLMVAFWRPLSAATHALDLSLWPGNAVLMMGAAAGMMAPIDDSIPRDREVSDRTLVVVWTPFDPAMYYSATKRDAQGTPRPGRTRILAVSSGDVSVSRVDGTNGVFDPPANGVAIQLSRADAGPATGAIYVDDIALLYPTAADVPVADFEAVVRALRIFVVGEPGTTVVTGNGLGPHLLLAPVPFAMARRRAADSTFVALYEPLADAPRIQSVTKLSTDAADDTEATAVAVTATDFADRLLVLANGTNGTTRTFGDAACDGTVCLVRRRAGADLARIALVEGRTVEQAGQTLLEATATLKVQADLSVDGAQLDLDSHVDSATVLRVLGPQVTAVNGGDVVEWTRDGDYVVLNLEPLSPDASPGDRDAGTGADGATGGCGCRAAGRGTSREPGRGPTLAELALAVTAVLGARGRRRGPLPPGVRGRIWQALEHPPIPVAPPARRSMIAGWLAFR